MTAALWASGRRILVTGVSGFVGSRIAARCAADGAIVAGLSRTRGRFADAIARGAAHLSVDLEDRDACTHAVRGFGPEVVFHFASRPDGPESVEHARASINANITATVNLVEAAAATAGAIVYGDSCKVFGAHAPPYREHTPVDPNSAYGATKAAGWWVCRSLAAASGIAAVSIRPTLIYGPGQGMNVIEFIATRALAGTPEIGLDGGDQTRDPLYIDDAVHAFLAAAAGASRLHGRALPIGGGSEIAVRDLAQHVVAACNAGSRIVCRPDRARPTEIWKSWCDNADAHRELGWSPKVRLTDGLAHTVQSIRARHDAGGMLS